MHIMRWGAGDDHNFLIMMDARRVFYYMGWRALDPGIVLSEAWACIPDTLP